MKIKNAVCYSFDLKYEGALAYLRLIGPLRQSGINVINGIENDQIIVNRVSEGDVVIIQREFPKQFDNYKKIIELARKEGKPVIFDLDDLLLYLPDNHQDRQSAKFGPSLLPMFQTLMEADLVSVPTPKLRDVLAKYNDNVEVLPNYFDDNLWRLTPPVLKDSSNEVLTIGYMGTSTHNPDLEYITPVLLDLIKRYPEKLRFHFSGVQPPAALESLPQVKWTPWYSFVYKDFAELFQTQFADIFIAPLVDNLFNRCKSPLKFFEYSALGAPGVFSRLDPYADVVKHGHNGLLASSLDEWKDCLIQLVENDELRFQLATNAQTTIRGKWLLSKNAFRWEEAFQNAIDTISSDREQNSHIVSIVKSINLQLFETFNKKEAAERALSAQVAEQDQTTQTLTDQLSQAGNELSQARNELSQAGNELSQAGNELEQLRADVLKYELSWSWQITRPLRIVKRTLKRLLGVINVQKMHQLIVRVGEKADINGKYYVEDFIRVYPDDIVFNRDGTPREISQTDRNNYLNHRKFYEFVAQFVKDKHVVDVGCGSGYGCQIIKNSGATSVKGTDLSSHSIDFAKSKFSQSAEFTIQEATNMNLYADNSFDLSICREVLEHLKGYGKEVVLLDELKRITKPNGLIIIGTPNSELLGEHGFWFEEIDTLFRDKFKNYLIFENAIEPFGDNKLIWQKRLLEGRNGVIVSEDINLDETVIISSEKHELKQGLKPGIMMFSGIKIDTSLLHNTHSWVVLAINNA